MSTLAPRILLVDDDQELCALLTEYLGRFGLTASSAREPEQALRAFRTQPPDVLVLDVMLPGQDGFALLRRIRETSRCPVVTASRASMASSKFALRIINFTPKIAS